MPSQPQVSPQLSLALQSTVCTVMYCSSYRWLGKTLSQLAWHAHATDMPTGSHGRPSCNIG